MATLPERLQPHMSQQLESARRMAYYRGLLSENLSHSTGDGVGAMSVAPEPEKALSYIERMCKPVGSRTLMIA